MATDDPTDERASLEKLLAEFKSQFERLPEPREPPRTTLQILGYERHERAWQALLFHFLSPDAAHGLGSALLEHILRALADRDDVGYEFSRFDLDGIQVETEVVAGDNRRPDAIVWAAEDWFICFELKVGAAEGGDQTTDYVEVGSFAGIDLDKQQVPEAGHHYIYLAPAGSAAPAAEEFAVVTWEWIASELQSFLATSHGEYPARTTAQLGDFIDTIRTELTMTAYRESQREKAELYVDYHDEIEAAREAFDRRWEAFASDWGERLVAALDIAEVRAVPDLDCSILALDLADTARGAERWYLRQGDSDWAGLIKEGWWRSKDDLSVVIPREETKDEFRISLSHRLKHNRELALGESTLKLQLWHGTSNGDEFMYRFKDNLYPKLEASGDVVPPSVEMTGRRANPINATYDIPVGEHPDFFEAYIAALREGFLDLVVDHGNLIELIDAAYEETLEGLG